MPSGEVTVTLQDVEVQLGLRVDGLPLQGSTDQEWKDICQELLGIRPTAAGHGRGGRINLGWMCSHFSGSMPDDADDDLIIRTTRAYMLAVLGGTIFPDKSGYFVHFMFLQMMRDFEVTGHYSWGGACLVWLYR